jgi:hypothetical protein
MVLSDMLETEGGTYGAVARRTRPSCRRKARRGDMDVTGMYTRKSNLSPSMRRGFAM